jgi:predicted small secreted protein
VRTIVSILVAGSLVMSACGTIRGGDASETPSAVRTSEEAGTARVADTTPVTRPPGTTETTPTETTPLPGGTPVTPATTPPDDHLARLVQSAVADLSGRLHVAPATIGVLRAEQVTWPDESLGCPRAGESYAQTQVEGYQIVLEHAARTYLYHAAAEGPAFLCPSDEKDGGHDFVPPPGFDR